MGPSEIQDGGLQHASMPQYGSHRMLDPSTEFTVPSSYDPYDLFSENSISRPHYPRFSQEEAFSNSFADPKAFHDMAHPGMAHEDSCMTSGIGPQYRPNAYNGTPASTLLRNKSITANLENPDAGHNLFQYGLSGSTLGYNDQGIFGPNDDKHHANRSWTETYGQYVPQLSQTGINRTEQQILQDQDRQWEACSVTTCDSRCDLSDPCTGEACANEMDACTDRTCPEKNSSDGNDLSNKLPPEVVNAAAALANIGGMPDYHDHGYSLPQQALPTPTSQDNFSPGFDWPLEPSLADISQHLLWAHREPNSSNCTRPCPVDNPTVFSHCHFPQLTMFGADSAWLANSLDMNPSCSGNSSFGDMPSNGAHFGRMKLEGCGREISNPEEFVNHFNTEHRHAIANSLPFSLLSNQRKRVHPDLNIKPEQSPYSPNDISPSLSTMRQSSSPQEPFPPTPQSLPLQRPGTSSRLQSTCHSRSSSAFPVVDGRHRCLWCNNEGTEPCGRMFADAEGLHTHVRDDHIKTMEKQGSDGFVCCWEGCKRDEGGKKGFPQRSKIERHMQTHIGRKPFQCEECGNRFSARQALEQHRLIHTNEKPLRCDWPGCEQTFRQQSALTMHKRTHTKEKPLSCPYCGKGFSESSNLSKHKRIHEGKGKFMCDRPGCEKSFHRKDQLRRHTLLHEQKEGMPGGRRPSTMSSLSAEEGLDDSFEDAEGETETRDAKRQRTGSTIGTEETEPMAHMTEVGWQ